MAQLAMPDSEEVLAQRREHNELPRLHGTPAQIEWADKIRESALSSLRRRTRELQERMGKLKEEGNLDESMRLGKMLIRTIEGTEKLKKVKYADYWIQRRDDLPSELLDEVVPAN